MRHRQNTMGWMWPGTISAGLVLLFALAGCGGHRSVFPIGEGGCGGVLTGATFAVQFPERSRDSTVLPSLSSALSAKLVISDAASPGGSDITFNLNRDPSKPAAHTEVFNLPSMATGTFPARLTLYSNADQTGTVVGTVTASDKVSCTGHTLSSVSLSAKAATVEVTPLALKVGDAAAQAMFSVKDASNAVIPVTPGSAIFTRTSGTAATISKDGMVTPVAAGTIQITAAVDGVTSSPATVTVTNTATLTYRIVDLGTGTPMPQGKVLNDDGMALIRSSDNTKAVVVNVNTLAMTDLGAALFLGTINNSDLVVGIGGGGSFYYQGPSYSPQSFAGSNRVIASNNLGNCIGGTTAGDAVYWDSPTASPTMLGSLNGVSTQNVQATAINGSKVIAGNGFMSSQVVACYYPSPTAGQATPLPALSGGRSLTTDINDSGAIVGFADSGSSEVAVIWDSPTTAPRSLGSLGTTPNAVANGINNAGIVVGVDQNSPTANKAFVYSASKGMQNLYDLCDSSRNNWQLLNAICINNHNWIYGLGTISGVTHTFVAIPNL